MRTLVAIPLILTLASAAVAADYHVGPGQALAAIGDVPWESLSAGDHVFIHWRTDPYTEKWVICRQGTEAQPIVVSGVPGPEGRFPVIDGRGATTRQALDYWNESRGVIKVGGASIPPDTLPAFIVIENLEVRSGRPPFTFTDHGGGSQTYADNAASIYVEKADHLTIRNCILRDSGNGLFVGAFDGQTQDVVIDSNRIYDNGIEGSIYEHNTYTAAIHITYQFNRFGPLRGTAGGNNLKDRSAGLVVRYNWIEGGNRQLDLVDAEDSQVLVDHPDYHTTYVYGNVLIEPDGAGNSQILHYGGDSGTVADYRKGTLHLYNNTVISTRSGNTTLMRLSTNDESAEVRNNIVYTTAAGSHLALMASSGVAALNGNWLKSGWVPSHDSFGGTLSVDPDNLEGDQPGFRDAAGQDFSLLGGSACDDSAGPLHPDVVGNHDILEEYMPHRRHIQRPADGILDIGAKESGVIFADDFEDGSVDAWSVVVY